MKRGLFLATFILTHIGFIFLQIHKHTQFIKQSYRKQKNEHLRDKLQHEQEERMYMLYALQDKPEIKKYAHNKLQMTYIHLDQIKKITDDNQ